MTKGVHNVAARKAAEKRQRPGEYVGFRSPTDLKEKLEAAAKANCRSLSSEAQFRLEQSFHHEGERNLTLDTLRRPQLTALASLLFVVMKEAGDLASGESFWKAGPGRATDALGEPIDWLADAYCYDQMLKAALTILEALRPSGNVDVLAVGRKVDNADRKELGRRAALQALRIVASPKEEKGSEVARKLRQNLGELVKRIDLQSLKQAASHTNAKAGDGVAE